jgi:hypothetical protein
MSKLNPKLEVGDRIVLLNMDDPFGPVKPGTFGTVIGVEKVPFRLVDEESDFHYKIDWDNGSKLALEPEVDTWVYKSDYDKRKGKKIEESYKTYEKLYEEYKKRGII